MLIQLLLTNHIYNEQDGCCAVNNGSQIYFLLIFKC